LILPSAFAAGNVSATPVVLWHGMGDNCCLPFSMGKIKSTIEKAVPGIFVHSIMTGGNVLSDEVGGFFGNMNHQVDTACKQLKAIPELAGGFNAVGFSQGGQLMRAYVQRCNDPPVRQLITMGAQHMGIADIPVCVGTNVILCKQMAELLGRGAYLPGVRNVSIQAQYFKDPMAQDDYLKHNIFLPDINNEGHEKKAHYKDNLASLERLVLIKFQYDFVVVPNDSSWFAYYPWGTLDRKKILPMNQTDLYQQDWIGLKTLDTQGKIVFKVCPAMHMKFSISYFKQEVLDPYLTPKSLLMTETVLV
jgi:palmitoyl-protein thioesterase